MPEGGGPADPTTGAEVWFDRVVALASLRRTRGQFRRPRETLLAVAIGGVYAIAALLVGQMLEIGPTGSTTTYFQVLRDPNSLQWWNYPALVVVTPHWLLALPFLATLAMGIVSAGVGLGMGAGLLLGIRVLRARRPALGRAGALSSLAGLTPGLLVLLTLGACCSTTAAAVAGIGAIAQSGGTTVNNLLLNTWYLNAFQIGVLWVALLAQEQLIGVYQGLLSEPASAPGTGPRPWPERLPGLAARVFLLSAGTLWGLAGLLELSTPTGAGPSAGTLVGVLLQHGLVGAAAIGAGLFPAELRTLGGPALRPVRTGARVLLAVLALTLALGTPPPLPALGVSGFGNLFAGLAHVPLSGGGVAPPAGDPTALFLGWGAVYALLGAVLLVGAVRPAWLLDRLAGGAPLRVRSTGSPSDPAIREEGLPA